MKPDFSPKILQETPQDVAFLQARVDFQEVWKLDEEMEQDWSKKSEAFFLLVFLGAMAEQEEREMSDCVWILSWNIGGNSNG